ncbi:MAG: putative sugar O-methyltransferase, partial [Acidimicrobiia bacterium]
LKHVGPSAWPAAWLGAETSDDAWVGLPWTKTERRFCTFFTRLLWQYATTRGYPPVLDLDEPTLGAPLPVHFGGRLISQDLANCALEIATLATAVDLGARQRFLEVGAGYGRTAYALLSLHPESTYTIVDIPPALDISQWYLEQLFDPARLRFVNALEPYELDPVDVALSISSLQEMTPEQVAGYLKLFDRVAGHVYLKQWRTWTNPVDKVTMRFDEYPYPRSWTQELCRAAPVQTMFDEAIWGVPDNS